MGLGLGLDLDLGLDLGLGLGLGLGLDLGLGLGLGLSPEKKRGKEKEKEREGEKKKTVKKKKGKKQKKRIEQGKVKKKGMIGPTPPTPPHLRTQGLERRPAGRQIRRGSCLVACRQLHRDAGRTRAARAARTTLASCRRLTPLLKLQPRHSRQGEAVAGGGTGGVALLV